MSYVSYVICQVFFPYYVIDPQLGEKQFFADVAFDLF